MSDVVDNSSFDQLFARHYGPIHRYLHRRVGKERADDLAAETFAQALASRANYRAEAGGARAWLFGIAANLVRRHYRHEERMLRAYARTGADPIADDAGALERLDARLAAPDLARALRELPRHERDVLLLHAWGELSYDELAGALGLPVGTVRSRLHRARARLRELLAASGQYVDKTPDVDPTVEEASR